MITIVLTREIRVKVTVVETVKSKNKMAAES